MLIAHATSARLLAEPIKRQAWPPQTKSPAYRPVVVRQTRDWISDRVCLGLPDHQDVLFNQRRVDDQANTALVINRHDKQGGSVKCASHPQPGVALPFHLQVDMLVMERDHLIYLSSMPACHFTA
ncbi:hypothetical protein GBA52_018910 [Prunus armeniaca]|nr:hypothetical protein GBA52_018910 [Prunus armeniaca]